MSKFTPPTALELFSAIGCSCCPPSTRTAAKAKKTKGGATAKPAAVRRAAGGAKRQPAATVPTEEIEAAVATLGISTRQMEAYPPVQKSEAKPLMELLRPWPQHFTARGEAERGEWMFQSDEQNQTFADFVKAVRTKGPNQPHQPTRARHTIYLLPFGSGSAPGKVGCFPDLELCRSFVEAWYGLPCVLLPPENIHLSKSVKKTASKERRQYHAKDILNAMLRKVPKDAHCLLGLTMEDIGVFERVTFLFGLASFAQRVGVFSFCRQDPAWYRGKARMTDDLRMVFERATEREEGDEATVTRRALWTLSHEIGHTYVQ